MDIILDVGLCSKIIHVCVANIGRQQLVFYQQRRRSHCQLKARSLASGMYSCFPPSLEELLQFLHELRFFTRLIPVRGRRLRFRRSVRVER